MIRLSLGSNTVILTLTESTTIATPTYLFQFENNQTHDKYYCISSDTSSYTDRYNKFIITVVAGVPVPLSGQVKLVIGDEYNYTIYAQASTTNLDPSLADEIVEIGYMKYDKTFTDRLEYNGSSTTRKAYEKA